MATIIRCDFHDKDELITSKTFEVCFECSHVWETKEELLKAYNEVRKEHAPLATPATDPNQVIWCPLCLHDFLF